MSYSIIDHADGPTAYFYAGKVGTTGNLGGGGFVFVWNWINIFGLLIVALLLIPNIIYAIKHKGERNLCENRFMNILEQIGRYGSMLFMAVCLKSGGYGFSSVALFLVYLVGNTLLLTAYWVVWGIYFYVARTEVIGWADGPTSVFMAGRRRGKGAGALQMSLAALPSCLFLLSGITLEYVPLIIFAIIFAVGHIYVTYANVIHQRKEPDQNDICM
ncbi:MAG: hypothetical protein NC331_05830 [Lachnospiraceae bacterium]|nr:hypothetical protein [Lachnospiraceae bacterium]MCM1238887.1 hypothetical protein [Lachnospiraceae bacterium]